MSEDDKLDVETRVRAEVLLIERGWRQVDAYVGLTPPTDAWGERELSWVHDTKGSPLTTHDLRSAYHVETGENL